MADKKPDVEMKDPNYAKASELKLSPLKPFTGKREELNDFIQEVNLYLDINNEMYYTDKKKIGYLLSFMNSRDAKSWKSQFLQSVTTNESTNLGTWDAFIKKLKEAFKPYEAPGDALEELLVLRMGNSSIEDHLARFKVLLEKSEVPKDSPSAINYFRKLLNYPLQKDLLRLPTPPKILKRGTNGHPGWTTTIANYSESSEGGEQMTEEKRNQEDDGTSKKRKETRMRWTLP